VPCTTKSHLPGVAVIKHAKPRRASPSRWTSLTPAACSNVAPRALTSE
jgi:hypothetical protein